MRVINVSDEGAADLFDKLKAGSAAPLAIHEKNTQRPTLNVQLKRSEKNIDFGGER